MSIAVLRPAYCWDCESCGRQNFQRCVSVMLDPDVPEDAEQLRFMHDLGPDEPLGPAAAGIWQTSPVTVTCAHCGATFKAAHDRAAGHDAGAGDEEDDL